MQLQKTWIHYVEFLKTVSGVPAEHQYIRHFPALGSSVLLLFRLCPGAPGAGEAGAAAAVTPSRAGS